MCGRYTVTVDPETIYGEFACVEDDAHRELVGGEYGGDIARPRYNIAPTDPVPVVLERATGGDGKTPVRRLEPMRWGLVPSWAKDVSVGSRMFNARVESLAGDGAKPAFRTALQRRRCLLPASGYYEWRKLDSPGGPRASRGRAAKQAYYVTPADGSLMAFAGLWEFWRSPEGEPVRSTTVITVPAAGALIGIHDRMPLLVPRTAWDRWLRTVSGTGAGVEALDAVLAEPDDDLLDSLELRPVGDRVGNVRNDGPDLIERVAPRVDLDDDPMRTRPTGGAPAARDQPTLL